jgi:hypothetical protein
MDGTEKKKTYLLEQWINKSELKGSRWSYMLNRFRYACRRTNGSRGSEHELPALQSSPTSSLGTRYKHALIGDVRNSEVHFTENFKHIFPDMKLHGLVPSFHIHVSVSDLSIPTIGPPLLLQKIGGPWPRSFISGNT